MGRIMVERGKGSDWARCNPKNTPAEQVPNLDPKNRADSFIAKGFCRPCTERDACLERAIEENITVGVWGARTAQERRRIIELRKQGIKFIN